RCLHHGGRRTRGPRLGASAHGELERLGGRHHAQARQTVLAGLRAASYGSGLGTHGARVRRTRRGPSPPSGQTPSRRVSAYRDICATGRMRYHCAAAGCTAFTTIRGHLVSRAGFQMNKILKKSVVHLVIISMLGFSSPMVAEAGVIGTLAGIEAAQRGRDLASVNAALAREEVRRQLAAMGVAPADVEARLASLTDAELRSEEH